MRGLWPRGLDLVESDPTETERLGPRLRRSRRSVAVIALTADPQVVGRLAVEWRCSPTPLRHGAPVVPQNVSAS